MNATYKNIVAPDQYIAATVEKIINSCIRFQKQNPAAAAIVRMSDLIRSISLDRDFGAEVDAETEARIDYINAVQDAIA